MSLQLRILVVDDYADGAQSLAIMLGQYGHQVEVAPDGETALAMAQASTPDVVLLDIGLPKMDGWQLAQCLRELPGPKQPVLVAISGFGTPWAPQNSQEAGIDMHLVKPVDPEFLQDLLCHFFRVGK